MLSCYIMLYPVISCYIYHKTAFSWNHSLTTAVCDAGGRGLRDALTLSGRGWAMEKKTWEKTDGFVVGTFQKKVMFDGKMTININNQKNMKKKT